MSMLHTRTLDCLVAYLRFNKLKQRWRHICHTLV